MTNPSEQCGSVRRLGVTREVALLAIITVAAVGLRLYQLGTWSLWIDEINTLRRVWNPSGLSTPFYTLLTAALLNQVEVTEWSLRLAPALVGALTIPVLYVLVRRMFDPTVALVTAGLLAISPWHLYFSQNARYYTFLLLFYTMALLVLYLAIEEDRPGYVLLALVLLVLAARERMHAWLLVPGVLVYLVMLQVVPFGKPPGYRRLKPGYVLAALALVIGIGYYWRGLIDVDSFLAYFWYPAPSPPHLMITHFTSQAGVALSLLAAWGAMHLLAGRSRAGLYLVVTAAVPILALMIMTPFVHVRGRYTMVSFPSAVILAAVGLRASFEYVARGRRWWAAFAWTAILLVLLAWDPTVRDLLYYLDRQGPGFLMAPLLILISFLIALGLIWHRGLGADWPGQEEQTRRSASLPIWAAVVLVPVLLHPLVSDTLYMEYEHGYRLDWKGIAADIQAQRGPADIVVLADPVIGRYYLGDSVLDEGDVDLDTVLDQGRPVWFVGEFVGPLQGEDFERWTKDNCQLVSDRDIFAGGQVRKMPAYRCLPGEPIRPEGQAEQAVDG